MWQIKCEVTIIDASGGNVIDASMLAAIAALRAFRKPETSVIADSEAGSPGVVVFHHSNDREPLPLALQHSPLTVTVALFRYSSDKKNSTNEVGMWGRLYKLATFV